MASSVTFRMDENLKEQAETMFDEMGINMTTALVAFVRATVREGKLPFELMSDEYALRKRIREKLAESEAAARDPSAKRFTHEEVFAPLRERYGYDE